MFGINRYHKNNTRNVLEKVEYIISIILCIYFVYSILNNAILTCIANNAYYTYYYIPEFMINYQGGFVRRGILGEILYQFFLIHPYPFHTVLIYSEAVVLLIFLIVSSFVFYKLKYIPIMPFAILVGGMKFYRRDFLMILIAFLVFYSIIKYLKNNKLKFLIYSIVASCFAILIYEPSFFFIMPISMLIFYQNNDKDKKSFNRIKKTIISFVLPFLTMFLVCVAKGNFTQANAIWQSWVPLFDYLKIEQPEIPEAIDFLAWSENIVEIGKHHLSCNYGIGNGCSMGFNYILVLGSLFFFLGMYILTITTPQKISSNKISKQLSSVYLFQFLCLLPMFSILSCDFGRTILYVIFTSYYLDYLIKSNNIEIQIPYIDKISHFFYTRISQISKHCLYVLHLIIIIFIPFNLYNGVPLTRSFFINEYWPIFRSLLSNF